MSTPLFDALAAYLARDPERLHMPGHKGSLPFPFAEAAPFDLTELPGTGSLFDDPGPMAGTEQLYEAFYGAGASLLSAGGSTLAIQGMLALFCPPGSRVLMGRGCHIAAVRTAGLLGLDPVWLYPGEYAGEGIPGRIGSHQVEQALAEHPDVSAVYLTSPDYFGTVCDIGRISQVCRRRGVPLLVDNAHGAHLIFYGMHPIGLGADACCDSLHKTLPALTGAALLHLRDASRKEAARRKMALFASTSPSYLILLSADQLAGRLEELWPRYLALSEKVAALRELAAERGVWTGDGTRDPARVTLRFGEDRRNDVIRLLETLKIEAEYLSNEAAVLLPGPQTDFRPLERLIRRLPKPGAAKESQAFTEPEKKLSIREALLTDSEEIPLGDAAGRVCAFPVSPCPPGIPLVMPGELIGEKENNLLNIYGVSSCFVVK